MTSIQTMVSRLETICSINSGTSNQDGVRQVGQWVASWFHGIADDVRFVTLPEITSVDDHGQRQRVQFADTIVATKRPTAAKQVLLGIHLDTVYGLDHPFQAVDGPFESETHGASVMRGPGVADAKGGLIVMLSALEAFESSVSSGDLDSQGVGWTVFLNPDEEIGSLASVGLLQELAASADFGMVYEPTLPDGKLIRQRKGSGNYSVVIRGRAAHAGRDHASGRNAIGALCRLFNELERISQDDSSFTVNLGRVQGGGPVNVVPDFAMGWFNVRVADQETSGRVQQQIRECVSKANEADGITVELDGTMTSPPKPCDEATSQLINRFTEVGARMGLNIETSESGGVCDGNKLAAAGLPNLDTLGPRGGHIHSDKEYVLIDSLLERSRLSFEVLMDFAKHPERYPSCRTRSSHE